MEASVEHEHHPEQEQGQVHDHDHDHDHDHEHEHEHDHEPDHEHEHEHVQEHVHEPEQENDHDQAASAPHDAPLPDSDDHHEHEHQHVHEEDDPEHEQVDHEHVPEHEHHHEHDEIPPHEHHEPQPEQQQPQQEQSHQTQAQPTQPAATDHPDQPHTHEPVLESAPAPTASGEPEATEALPPPVPESSPTRAPDLAKPLAAPTPLSRTNGSAPRRRSSERYHASSDQLRLLVQAFEQDPTPSAATLTYLSTTIGMPMHNMVLWFKNRRARHKKHNPAQSAAKTGRRSYVKSGIYARSSKKSKDVQNTGTANPGVLPAHSPTDQANAEATAAAAADVTTEPQANADAQAESEMQQVALLTAAVEASAPIVDGQSAAVGVVPDSADKAEGMPMSTGKRRFEDGVTGEGIPATKRSRYQGVHEVVGDENPCRVWDAQECHQRCCAFFIKSTAACQQPEQTKAAEAVAEAFFLGELQSGLTLTSAMQSLETSAGVLDTIMDRVPEEGQGVRLSSGSRAVLREFVAQIRSGQAIHVETDGQPEEMATVEAEQPNMQPKQESNEQPNMQPNMQPNGVEPVSEVVGTSVEVAAAAAMAAADAAAAE